MVQLKVECVVGPPITANETIPLTIDDVSCLTTMEYDDVTRVGVAVKV